MKKKFMRIIATAMAVVVLISSVAFAADARASAFISYKGGGITALGDGDMRIVFNLTATGMMNTLGADSIYIHTADGTLVETIEYTDPGYSNMMTTNNYSYSSSITWSGDSGETYYAIIMFYAKNSSGYDYRAFTTTAVTV